MAARGGRGLLNSGGSVGDVEADVEPAAHHDVRPAAVQHGLARHGVVPEVPHHEQAARRNVREPHHERELLPEDDLRLGHDQEVAQRDQDEDRALEAAGGGLRGRVRRDDAEAEQQHRHREGRARDVEHVDRRGEHALREGVLQADERPEADLPHHAVLDLVLAVDGLRRDLPAVDEPHRAEGVDAREERRRHEEHEGDADRDARVREGAVVQHRVHVQRRVLPRQLRVRDARDVRVHRGGLPELVAREPHREAARVVRREGVEVRQRRRVHEERPLQGQVHQHDHHRDKLRRGQRDGRAARAGHECGAPPQPLIGVRAILARTPPAGHMAEGVRRRQPRPRAYEAVAGTLASFPEPLDVYR
eukprot:1828228-Rhodomonas_salina.1